MNRISRTLTGTVTILLGLYLSLKGISNYWILFYGIPLIIIGIFILFNKNEDKIEKIKRRKK